MSKKYPDMLATYPYSQRRQQTLLKGPAQMPARNPKPDVREGRLNIALNRERFRGYLAHDPNRETAEECPWRAALDAGISVPTPPKEWKKTFEDSFRVARSNGASVMGAMMLALINTWEEDL